jgi:hypothetical protein
MRWLRNTTFAGVTARLRPTSKLLVSTWRGRPPLLRTSSRNCRAPATTLPPAVSNARLSAAGFDGRKLVGASASSTKSTNIAALRATSGATGAAPTASRAHRHAAR